MARGEVVLVVSYRICRIWFSLVSVVSFRSLRWFRGFRFARFVSLFRVLVHADKYSKYRSNHDWVWLLVGPMAVLQNQNKCKLLLTLK